MKFEIPLENVLFETIIHEHLDVCI
jgi:hypothetical protein